MRESELINKRKDCQGKEGKGRKEKKEHQILQLLSVMV